MYHLRSMWGDEHFEIEPAKILKEDFFLLDLRRDPHAKDALLAYADSCQFLSPVKAEELRIVASKL